jgi:hypothetical protein
MEQAPRNLHIKCQPPPRDAREGVLRTFCDVFTTRTSNGVDARNEGFYSVCLRIYIRTIVTIIDYSLHRKCSESGIIAWDCKSDEEILLDPYGLLFGGDNPMQAEEASHGGLTCNCLCRTCKCGGTKVYKQSDEGYATLFKVFERHVFVPRYLRCNRPESNVHPKTQMPSSSNNSSYRRSRAEQIKSRK